MRMIQNRVYNQIETSSKFHFSILLSTQLFMGYLYCYLYNSSTILVFPYNTIIWQCLYESTQFIYNYINGAKHKFFYRYFRRHYEATYLCLAMPIKCKFSLGFLVSFLLFSSSAIPQTRMSKVYVVRLHYCNLINSLLWNWVAFLMVYEERAFTSYLVLFIFFLLNIIFV